MVSKVNSFVMRHYNIPADIFYTFIQPILGICCTYGNGTMKISVGGEVLVEVGDEDFKTKEYEFDVFSTGSTDVTTDSVSTTVSASTGGSSTTFAMEVAANMTTVGPTTTDSGSSTAAADTTDIASTESASTAAAANTTDMASTESASTAAPGTGSTTSSIFNTVSAFATTDSTEMGTDMGSTLAAVDSTAVAESTAVAMETSTVGPPATTSATVSMESTSAAIDTTVSSASGSGEYCITVEMMTDSFAKSESAYAFSSKPSNNAEDPVVYFAKAVGDLENEQMYEDTVCVPAGTYELYVEDSFRGIAPGYYAVKVDGVQVLYGGEYNTFIGGSMTHDIIVGQDAVLSERATEWLVAHNTRREEFHTAEGTEYRPLVWSDSLAEDADNWLDTILTDCTTHKEPNLVEGENLSFRKVGSERDTEVPDNMLKRWVDYKANKDYPDNESFTQAMWRATRYVGCADRSKTLSDGQICYASICRYARAGNCVMGKYDDWKIPTLADRTPCGPVCPDDGCH